MSVEGVLTRPPPILCLMGPTASGKTELAMALAGAFPVDVISVDSALVYRGLDIGTAKPSREALAAVPHRLIDIRDPAERYSAAEFRADALAAIASIHRAGRIPLLVGGTMLYFRALRYGLADLPGANVAVRARLEAQAARHGWPALHARLRRIDPTTAARLHPNDAQRVQRALEVWELSGRPMSEHYAGAGRERLPYPVVNLIVAPERRESLHRRIECRFREMLTAGFVDEVAALRSRGDLSPALPSMRAVGYRQVWGYLDGLYDYPEMATRAIAASRQFAKRQLTWLRREEDSDWFEATAADIVNRLQARLSRVLNSRP